MSFQMRTIARSIAFATLLALATGAMAQDQPERGGARPRGMPRNFGGLRLFFFSQVQDELKLTDDQKTKLRELSEELRAERQKRIGNLDDLSPEQRRQKFEEIRQQMQKEAPKLAEDLRKKVGAILKPDQVKRWRQIELQQEGPQALLRPEVAEAVGLTADQKTKLEQISHDAQEKAGALFRELRGGDRQTRDERMSQLREKARKIREEGEKQAMALLKPEQKKKLVEMMGEPFHLERNR